MRLLLLLFPRHVRERHGAEVLDSIARSDRPWRDAADLVVAALRLRLDQARSDGRMVYSLGFGLVAATSASALLCDCTVLGSMAAVGVSGLVVLSLSNGFAGPPPGEA